MKLFGQYFGDGTTQTFTLPTSIASSDFLAVKVDDVFVTLVSNTTTAFTLTVAPGLNSTVNVYVATSDVLSAGKLSANSAQIGGLTVTKTIGSPVVAAPASHDVVFGSPIMVGQYGISFGGSAFLAGAIALVNGTAEVDTSGVTDNSLIFLTPQGPAGAVHAAVEVSARVSGSSFTILSASDTDARTIGWMIVDQ